MVLDDMKTGMSYTFQTLAPNVLGADFNDYKLSAVLQYEAALMFDANITAMFNLVMPNISDLPNKNPSDYVWYLFTNDNGNKYVICSAWIDVESLQSVESLVANIRFTVNSISLYNKILEQIAMYDVTILSNTLTHV